MFGLSEGAQVLVITTISGAVAAVARAWWDHRRAMLKHHQEEVNPVIVALKAEVERLEAERDACDEELHAERRKRRALELANDDLARRLKERELELAELRRGSDE